MFYAFGLINPRSSFQSLLSRSSIPVRSFFLTIPLLFICQKIQQKVNSYDFKAQYHTLLYFHVLFIYFFRNCSSLFSGEFEGKYKPLSEFSKTSNPVDNSSQPTSPLTTCSGRARDWPESRGIFRNKDNTFVVFVNEDDHVQFRCFDKGGNLQAVFNKLVRGMAAFERELKKSGEEFMWDDHLGYIVSDPIHLGTALDVRVRVKLHHLSTVSR